MSKRKVKKNAEVNTSSERVIVTPTKFAQSSCLYVQEVGRLKSLKPHISERESLDSYLFLIVLSGEGSVNCRGETHRMSFGNCALIDCRQKYYHISSAERPWELMWVHFNGNKASSLYEQFIRINPKGVFRSSNVHNYKRPLEEMLRLNREHDNLTEIMSNKYLTDIITQCCLDSEYDAEEPDDSLKRKLPEIREYLNENYTRKILLEELAEEFYVSKFHLSREFKNEYDITVGNYLLNLRIGRAKELLRFTSMPIEEIAAECGINDTGYFTKIFRKSEGMTALQYRHKWGSVV